MRERGLAKTPDILLPVPIAVKDSTGDWHIVKWIDSKAMFGYPDSFKEQVIVLLLHSHNSYKVHNCRLVSEILLCLLQSLIC
jgi:Protein of unknown function TPD sequence-motif